MLSYSVTLPISSLLTWLHSLHTGLRVDGCRPPELRKLQCRLGVSRQADGSAYLEQGNTKVLATVYGPHDVRMQLNPPFTLSCFHILCMCILLSYTPFDMWNSSL